MDARMKAKRAKIAQSMLHDSIDLLNDALEYVDEGPAKKELQETLDKLDLAIDTYKGELQNGS